MMYLSVIQELILLDTYLTLINVRKEVLKMRLEEIIKEVERRNKVNSKLLLNKKYYIHVEVRELTGKRFNLYTKKDLQEIISYYIPEVSDYILNSKYYYDSVMNCISLKDFKRFYDCNMYVDLYIEER